jgi:hypothetical protein
MTMNFLRWSDPRIDNIQRIPGAVQRQRCASPTLEPAKLEQSRLLSTWKQGHDDKQ